MPDDFDFVLALHEASVVGMATGFAIGRGAPALALVHTTAGLGNAVGAIANTASSRVPLVILVGQQDRRHLAQEPFLAGRLADLAGEYPVALIEPVRPQDVPGAIACAYHAAIEEAGPALVIVSQDDWLCHAPEPHEILGPTRLVRGRTAAPVEAIDALVEILDQARFPALLVGAGAAQQGTWDSLVDLAERIGCPVWNEPFGARPGFPQDHPQFVGFLPANRGRLRDLLASHDALLMVGGPFLRQYIYAPGPLTARSDQTVALLTARPDEANRAPVDLAIVAELAQTVRTVTARVAPKPLAELPARETLPAPEPRRPDGSLATADVYEALAQRLPSDVILIEESPSSRHELNVRLPARTPLGFVTAAMGGLGFAMPGAAGLRMAIPDRPVVAIIGDGSSLYSIQALWSAVHYRIGPLFVILCNGGYRVMDHLAGGTHVWPSFEDISISGFASAQGCESRRVATRESLDSCLDEIVPTLAARDAPLLLEVIVQPGQSVYMP